MTSPRQILVIDDEEDRLHQLATAVQDQLPGIAVTTWQPVAGSEDPVETFQHHLEKPTGLIVTDHDLTKGITGLLGSNITAWSQQRFIAVCNFSRNPRSNLPRQSNFFELRVPAEPDETARAEFVASVYRGFQTLHDYVSAHHDGIAPAAALLAGAMGYPSLQDELAPYITSVGSASSSILQSLREAGDMPVGDAQADFQAFILGHVLINAVLEFPGPVLSRQTLTAYCAFGEEATDDIANLFADAAYTGPFAAPGSYFIRALVDERIDQLAASLAGVELTATEVDEYNHAVVEQAIGRGVPHQCPRCEGTRGGLWCPFTKRPVCTREDCSVTSATWIPRGATLCRVERDYHDEWAPLLGE